MVLSAGCVDTSPDRVKLTAEVRDVSLTLEEGALVTALTGSFGLELSVGDYAGEAVTVEAPTVDLVTADDRTSLLRVDALPVGVEFPLTIAEDASRTVTFELTDENTVDADQTSRLCAGPVRVSVTYRDSLADRPSLVESGPAPLAGCP
jgi:hypothetical protein